MQKKLTITLDERVYEGLHKFIGRRKISQFIESLVRPHVIGADLGMEAGVLSCDGVSLFIAQVGIGVPVFVDGVALSRQIHLPIP